MNFQILDAMFSRKVHAHPDLASVALVEAIGGDSNAHDHDDRYYTETELDGGQLDQRYYTETEVDNMIANLADDDHNHPVSCFKAIAEAGIPQALAATTYLKVIWSDIAYQYNSPGFSLSSNSHEPDEDVLGLWHYDVGIRITDAVQIFIAAVHQPSGDFIAHVGDPSGRKTLSFDHNWTDTGDEIEVHVWAAIATTIDQQPFNCYFNGHRVGPIS